MYCIINKLAHRTSSAMIINHLLELADKSPDTMVAYGYIRYSDKPSTNSILTGMLRQIARRDASAAQVIGRVFSRHKRDNTEATTGELVDLLKAVLTPYRLRQIILDGLDESPEDVQIELMEIVTSIDASALIFARPLELFRSGLPEAKFIEVSAETEDIEILISHHISRFHKLRALVDRHNLREEVLETIVRKASGM